MSEYEFILLYLQSTDDVKKQIEIILSSQP